VQLPYTSMAVSIGATVVCDTVVGGGTAEVDGGTLVGGALVVVVEVDVAGGLPAVATFDVDPHAAPAIKAIHNANNRQRSTRSYCPIPSAPASA
jgi:hypothetical protein